MKVASVVPLFPSVTTTSSIESAGNTATSFVEVLLRGSGSGPSPSTVAVAAIAPTAVGITVISTATVLASVPIAHVTA